MPDKPVDGGYQPAYAHGLPNPNATARGTDQPAPATTGTQWESAPATSHIHSWAWYPTSGGQNRLLRIGGQRPGQSQLLVRFKNEKTGGYTHTYVYWFADAAAGQAIVEQLRGAAHPYGSVLYPMVIKGGIPYSKAT